MRLSLVGYGLLFVLGLWGLQACDVSVSLSTGERPASHEGKPEREAGLPDASPEPPTAERTAEGAPEALAEEKPEALLEARPEIQAEETPEGTDVCSSCTQLLTKVCPGLSLAEGETLEGIKGATVLLRGKTGFLLFDLDTCTRAEVVGPSLTAKLFDVSPEAFLFSESVTQPERKTTFFWLRGPSLTQKEFLGWSFFSNSTIQERGIIRLEQNERFLYVFVDAPQQRLDGWETTRDVSLFPVSQGATHDVYMINAASSSGRSFLVWDVKNKRVANQGEFEGWTAYAYLMSPQGLLSLDCQQTDKLHCKLSLWPFQAQGTAQTLLSLPNLPRFSFPILLAEASEVLLLVDTTAYHVSLVTGVMVPFDVSFLGVSFNSYSGPRRDRMHFSKGALILAQEGDLVKVTFQPDKGTFLHQRLSPLPARPGSLLQVVGSDRESSPRYIPPGVPPRFWLLRRTSKDSPSPELLAFDLHTGTFTPWFEGPFAPPPENSRIPEGWRFYPHSLSYYVNPTNGKTQRVSVRLDTGRRFFTSPNSDTIIQMEPPGYLQRLEIIPDPHPVTSIRYDLVDHKCFKAATHTAPLVKHPLFASDRYIATFEGDAAKPRLALYKVCPLP